MKTTFKITILATALVLMLIADMPFLPMQLVSEADAVMGVRRRTRRRTAVVVGSAAASQTAAAQQQTTAAQQQTTAAQQQATAAQQQAATTTPPPPAAAASQPLPLGAVVTALPAGCTSTPVGGVEYYHCGANYFRAVFQGNSLVYVTAKPE